jgi:hypothetical protein
MPVAGQLYVHFYPRAKRPLLAECLKANCQLSLSLKILIPKWRINLLYAKIEI